MKVNSCFSALIQQWSLLRGLTSCSFLRFWKHVPPLLLEDAQWEVVNTMTLGACTEHMVATLSLINKSIVFCVTTYFFLTYHIMLLGIFKINYRFSFNHSFLY